MIVPPILDKWLVSLKSPSSRGADFSLNSNLEKGVDFSRIPLLRGVPKGRGLSGYKEALSMEQLLTYTANYGFPMVISVYLLVRIEGKLEQLTGSINDLAKIIATKL